MLEPDMAADLPIYAVLSELRARLRESRSVVLQAPPGAGKSTVVPLALLDEPWLDGQRILMLEPRRLATRAVAAHMAKTLRQSVGELVGYRMRFESRLSTATRIQIITEGVLTSLLQRDPALEGVGCVIFDEFHERSLQADLGLALCLDIQAHLNESLRLLVMSATLAADAVAGLLNNAPIVRATGRSFPVDVRYARRTGTTELPGHPREVAAAVRRAIAEEEGDVLVFLPGAAEIRRVQKLLAQTDSKEKHELLPLYGDLQQQEQERALAPGVAGKRKIVLSTNIAETSLTIQGVRIVVDSGLARRARFDPVSGMSRLQTVRISRASAEQRSGRAGRTEPGVCYRQWTAGSHQTLQPYTPAEILEADLAPLTLELAGWNITDPQQLRWLDPPPQAAHNQARDLLRRLGALDGHGRITPHGRQLLELPVHPRLAHMLVRARELGQLAVACDLAALLEERDVLRKGMDEQDADIRLRLELLRAGPQNAEDVDRAALQRVRKLSAQYRLQLRSEHSPAQSQASETAGLLLALAYPDRIARARAPASGRYRLSNGRGAFFAHAQSIARAEFLTVAELDGGEREARIFLAAPLQRAELERAFSNQITIEERILWSSKEQAVLADRARKLGELVIEETMLMQPDPEEVRTALLAGIRQMTLVVLPWDHKAREWQARVQFVREFLIQQGVHTTWPVVSDEMLLDSLEHWLGPWLDGMSRREHLARLNLLEALESLLDWEQRKQLELYAPTHIIVPSGSRIPISYLDAQLPSISVALQEVFGLQESPRIAGGQIPLLVKLLSPARRPVQVTRDLASFWRSGYLEVRKELKGRYPKHYWPEDPSRAQPIRSTRQRKSPK